MVTRMQKHDLSLFMTLAVLLWMVVAWYWYVCGLKGLCEFVDRDPPTPVVERVPVEDRRDEVVRGEGQERAEEVVLECPSHLSSPLRLGSENRKWEVRRLEDFLNTYEGEDVAEDGVFTPAEEAAVKRFQLKYRREVLDPWGLSVPSGYVGETTRNQINALHCALTYREEGR